MPGVRSLGTLGIGLGGAGPAQGAVEAARRRDLELDPGGFAPGGEEVVDVALRVVASGPQQAEGLCGGVLDELPGAQSIGLDGARTGQDPAAPLMRQVGRGEGHQGGHVLVGGGLDGAAAQFLVVQVGPLTGAGKQVTLIGHECHRSGPGRGEGMAHPT